MRTGTVTLLRREYSKSRSCPKTRVLAATLAGTFIGPVFWDAFFGIRVRESSNCTIFFGASFRRASHLGRGGVRGRPRTVQISNLAGKRGAGQESQCAWEGTPSMYR